MNVSEYLVNFLVLKGIDRVFAVVGGASLWLNKALKECGQIKTVFTNHEQCAVMAADGWARIKRMPGIVFTINGPGMTNSVTGIAQAWTDSSPVILITGNSNSQYVEYERNCNIRQYGTQDVRTDLIMQGITKKTYLLKKGEDVRSVLEEAWWVAMEGRPGPVCIEIPINIQSESISEFMSGRKTGENTVHCCEKKKVLDILHRIHLAQRPLILAGQGVRLADACNLFKAFTEAFHVPVVTSRMGIDVISTESRYFVGRPGNHGTRPAHFALQTCDLLLILGSRLAPNTTGYAADKFSGQSYKILIDIDEKELGKKDVKIEEICLWDLKSFLITALGFKEHTEWSTHDGWIERCVNWKNKYPVMKAEYSLSKTLNTYHVIDRLSEKALEGDYILADTGSCCSITAQVWKVKEKQRLFISGGLSAMGYWATSMGLCFSKPQLNRVICIVGDGSLQMNIQELATIVRYHLPLKLFLINNGGYQFVRMSQKSYDIDPPYGTDRAGGVPLPDNERIIKAYGLKYFRCDSPENLETVLGLTLTEPGTAVCELFVDYEQEVLPRLKSTADAGGNFISPAYENLYPFLDSDLLKRELENV